MYRFDGAVVFYDVLVLELFHQMSFFQQLHQLLALDPINTNPLDCNKITSL